MKNIVKLKIIAILQVNLDVQHKSYAIQNTLYLKKLL